MSATPKVLVPAKTIESGLTLQYKSTNLTTIIDKFTVVNYTTGTPKLSVYIVPSGSDSADANVITKTRTFAPLEVYTFPEIVGHIMASNDFITTNPDTADAFSLRASGRAIPS